MKRRMTPEAFSYLKKEFPEDFKKMAVLDIDVSRFDLFRVKKKKNKTNKDRFGDKLAGILEWLDGNCDQPFYARMNYRESKFQGSSVVTVSFYFIEPTDAMAFKLMFQ